MSLRLNSSGGGSVTLQEPTTASNLTIDLPAVAGTLYNNQNILGTVSQTSGVPTGAVIQRGSNANGEFVRFADGTQICYVTGNGWTGGFITMNYLLPASMINQNAAIAWNSRPSTNHHVVACAWCDNNTSVSFRHPDTSTQAWFIAAYNRWF